jgi:hypothetical protein
MKLTRLSVALVATLLASTAVTAGCSGRRAADTDDGGAEGATPTTGDDFDPTPSSDPPLGEGTSGDDGGADAGADGDASMDGGFGDAGPDGAAPFCREYRDETRRPGGGPGGQITVAFGDEDTPRAPNPQCLRIRQGRAVRFVGDLQENPVVILTAQGPVQLALDPGRDDRSTYVFAQPGSFYFATVKNPDIEKGHIQVVP